MGTHGAVLSPGAFTHLASHATASLARSGVAATFASTAGSRNAPGPTWISVTSPWGYGRLVRRGDGSFESTAYRSGDGMLLLHEEGDDVRATDFDDLVAAIARPEPGPPTRPGRWV
jgi:hypothetical protein